MPPYRTIPSNEEPKKTALFPSLASFSLGSSFFFGSLLVHPGQL